MFGRKPPIELDVIDYALAIFAALLELLPGDVKPHLTTNPRGDFLRARKHIARERRGDIADLARL